MKTKHLFFAALFLAALAFGFSACENPGDFLNNGDDSSITDNDSTTNNPSQGDDSNSNNGDESERPIPDISSTLVTTGAATDVEYSCVTLWGRLNTDSLPMVGNVTGWGIEYAYNRESVESHKHSETTKVKCTTELQGENADEFSVKCYGLNGDTTIYYSAYAMVDMKYIYGDVHSVRLLSRLTLLSNGYGWVSGEGDYPLGTQVTITATPEENYYFTSWSDGNSDNPRTVVVNSDTTFTANFAKKPYLTVNVNSDTNWGKVSGSGYYDIGAEATITATPNRGFYFVKWNDGNTDNPRTVTINEDITYTATFAGNPNGTENGYEWVDLGLSVNWATCNVGASSPEEYGNYYAWGEVEPKEVYDWSTYKFMDSSVNDWNGVNKYTVADSQNEYGDVVWYDNSGNFIGDNKTVLEKEDDAATVNMGGSWRMPTAEEQQELIDECTWTWTTLNGVNGYNVEGPNGNSIFLPAARYRLYSDLSYAGSHGYYWSSSLHTDSSNFAYNLRFDSDYVYWLDYNYRCCGQSVRGVFSR